MSPTRIAADAPERLARPLAAQLLRGVASPALPDALHRRRAKVGDDVADDARALSSDDVRVSADPADAPLGYETHYLNKCGECTAAVRAPVAAER